MASKVKALLSLFFLSLLAAPLFGSETADAAPSFSQRSWNALLVVRPVSEVDKSLTSRISAALLKGFNSPFRHELSAQEQSALQNYVKKTSLSKQITALSLAVETRDSAALKTGSYDALRVTNAKIQKQREKITQTRQIALTDIPVPSFILTSLASLSKRESPFDSDASLLKKSRSFVLIEATVEIQGGYAHYAMQAIYTALDLKMPIYEDFPKKDDLMASVQKSRAALRTFLLGRPWSGLKVTVLPKEAQATVTVHRPYFSVRGAQRDNLFPGKARVEVSAPGYLTISKNIELTSEKTLPLTVTLKRGAQKQVLISTSPAGASLYVNGLYQGTTPTKLSISRQEPTSVIRVVKEGYAPHVFPLKPNEVFAKASLSKKKGSAADAAQIAIPLTPLSTLTSTQKAKKQYQDSMVGFGVSTLFPILFFGAAMGAQTHPGEQYNNISISLHALGWAAIGVSVGLLVNLVIKTIQYQKALEREAQK